ncbi:MAG TPA: PstS family phosphate ABC transporter substrate-binding protein [Thermoanaerobaculia bacterium]|nr:PstS family phosphate ABC transporter substrate-binding protein [Thermoanaerobaculia bacterium]
MLAARTRTAAPAAAVALVLLVAACGPAAARGPAGDSAAADSAPLREQIRVVGSSTVYPFTTKVAEQLARTTDLSAPVVESTGTGGGFKLFCAGVGGEHPDVANASRAIKPSEVELCAGNGVRGITEIRIGYDGIVVAHAAGGEPFALTRRQLFLALARQVPQGDAAGKLVDNPYTSWHQIDPSLPAREIEVLGPPPTSGTRDAFVELVLEPGCGEWEWIAALADSDEGRFQEICHTLREDGAWVEAGENDNLIVQKLAANPDALGVFGYSFLDENRDRLAGATVDGVAPTFEAIAAGRYPVSRPLFVYVKDAHVGRVPGLAELVREYVSDRAIGGEGYLTELGLVPLPAAELARVRQAAAELVGG